MLRTDASVLVDEDEAMATRSVALAHDLAAPPVEFLPAAVAQVRRLIQGQKPEIGVRVYAQAGGKGCCGGGAGAVEFGMAFAKARPDDEVIRLDGFSVLVDPSSVALVHGAVVDFVETLSESGFKITNPTLPEPDAAGQAGGCSSCGSNASNGGGCGCCG